MNSQVAGGQVSLQTDSAPQVSSTRSAKGMISDSKAEGRMNPPSLFHPIPVSFFVFKAFVLEYTKGKK